MDDTRGEAHPDWDSVRQQRIVERGLTDRDTGERLPIEAMAAVGSVSGAQFRDAGYDYVYQLVGEYMVNSMDDEATDHWLRNKIGIRRPDLRQTIVRTLQMWCERHI